MSKAREWWICSSLGPGYENQIRGPYVEGVAVTEKSAYEKAVAALREIAKWQSSAWTDEMIKMQQIANHTLVIELGELD